MGKMLGLCSLPQPKIILELQGAEGPGREVLSSQAAGAERLWYIMRNAFPTSLAKQQMGLLQKPCELTASTPLPLLGEGCSPSGEGWGPQTVCLHLELEETHPRLLLSSPYTKSRTVATGAQAAGLASRPAYIPCHCVAQPEIICDGGFMTDTV